MKDTYPPISFENTEIAYKSLSDSELKKAYYLFKMMGYNQLVKIGNQVINFLLKFNFPIEGIVRNTIFKHFCGGETLENTIPLINKLKQSNIEVLLNYSVEGLENAASYKNTFDKTLEAIHFAGENTSIRAICIKFTGFANMNIWTKLQNQEPLNSEEQEEFEQAKYYIKTLCNAAVESRVHLYVDAEESWFQSSIDDLTDELMAQFNREEAIIFNTFQLYRNDKLKHLESSIALAKANGYILGAKLVRGAYVEKENDYAQKNNIPSPIHRSKKETDIDFNLGIELCIQNLEHVSICCASHNEYSNLYFVELIQKNNIPLDHKHLCISQLLGMSDNITYNIASLGIPTAKYVPFGPVREVIPYLIRRSQENTSVEGQTSREFTLLSIEKKRRGI